MRMYYISGDVYDPNMKRQLSSLAERQGSLFVIARQP